MFENLYGFRDLAKVGIFEWVSFPTNEVGIGPSTSVMGGIGAPHFDMGTGEAQYLSNAATFR